MALEIDSQSTRAARGLCEDRNSEKDASEQHEAWADQPSEAIGGEMQ